MLPSERSIETSLSLGALQSWFFGVVLSQTEPVQLGVNGRVGDGKLTAERRVGIYQRAYALRLVECLRDDFPGVERVIGRERFEECARAYVARHTPRSVSLNCYGQYFPVFLRDYGCHGLPVWLWELATLEWATVHAIHAEFREQIQLAALAAVPAEQWERLSLRVGPSVQWLTFNYDVDDVLTRFDATHREEVPLRTRLHVAVGRKADAVWRLRLEPWAFELLQALGSGVPLGLALSQAVHDHPTLETQQDSLMKCFRNWVKLGVFAGFTMTG